MSSAEVDCWERYVELLRGGWSNSKAAREAGVTPLAARNRRRRDEGFEEMCREAEQEGVDRLEDEMTERALNGTPKDIVWGGAVTGQETVHDNRLLETVVERKRPRGRTGQTAVEDLAEVLEMVARARLAREERKALEAKRADMEAGPI